MTKTISFNLIKIFAAAAVAFALSILLTRAVSSQTASPAPSPAPTNTLEAALTFPINELGGCSDYSSCFTYCNDPVNNTACSQFAEQHGFYQEDPTNAADAAFWQRAEQTLGCNSADSCSTHCSDPANIDACDAFARSETIPGGYVDEPDKPEYLDLASDVLGCDSAATCATHCDDPANQQACSDFAHDVGLLGGTTTEGPGGCTSTETCQAYCSDPNNFASCSQAAPAGTTFTGPGGCDSTDTCRDYCETNAEDCRSYTLGTNGVYVPVACGTGETLAPGGICSPIEDMPVVYQCASASGFWDGSNCTEPPVGITPTVKTAYFEPRPDMDGCATPATCYDYCAANPGTCEGFDASQPRPDETYNPVVYVTPGLPVTHDPIPEMGNCNSPGSCWDYCSANPTSCSGFDPDSPRPIDIYVPDTYYTPPSDVVYVTPPLTNYYVTPIYPTPPAGSTYTSPPYYTPGIYSTPSYTTPPPGSNYTTPTYYTPGSYVSPFYYTPPPGSDYTTPTYYTPPPYISPSYYTPPGIVDYTTPTYYTPPSYPSPTYFTPPPGSDYTSPTYYTPPPYASPAYYTPPCFAPPCNYPSPSYYTPPPYISPYYYTPPPGGDYTTPNYTTPPPNTSKSYYTPR